MPKLTRRHALGPILLLLSGCLIVFSGFQLVLDRLVQSWLAEAITQYLGLDATPSIEVYRFVFSLSTILAMAGVAVILGTVIWGASPQPPHRGADLIAAIGKIVISFGVSIATLPLATMLFGVWATVVLSRAEFQTNWLVFLVPSLGFQVAGLVLTGAGSILFAGFRHRIQ